MVVKTRSSEPIARIDKIFRNGKTKLWLRKDIQQIVDNDGNNTYKAQESTLLVDGDYDVSSISDDQFEELWDESTETPISLDDVLDVIPTLLKTSNLSDEDAGMFRALYPRFVPGNSYKKDNIVRHDGELYRIGQDLTGDQTKIYKPGDDGTTALYSHISVGSDGYEVWQPYDGVSGAYEYGQIVRDPNDNQLYISTLEGVANVWGPPSQQGDYWDLYTGE